MMVLRMLTRVGIGVGLACTLAACDGDGSPQAASGSTEALPMYMLSADGVGPLNAETPFNLIQIGNAFQNLNVAQETLFNQGEKYPVITVKQQVKPLLSINPDYQQKGLFSVIVHDNLIGNGLGHKIGMRFSEIYVYGKTEACAPGMDDWEGKVMCYAPGNKSILYLFSGSWDGAKDQLPSPEVMASWVLEAMVWKAPPKQ